VLSAGAGYDDVPRLSSNRHPLSDLVTQDTKKKLDNGFDAM
jgi:hypothetical protein